MKRIIIALMLVLLALTGCTQKESIDTMVGDQEIVTKDEIPDEYVFVKQSDDKHIAYMKNYVGRNLASVGYTSMGGDRNDYLGDEIITLWIQTPDGHYVDIEDEEALKQYVVVGQGYEPNTEVRFEYEIDENGEENWYPNFCNFKYMVIQVRKIDDKSKFESKPTEIKLADDKYTWYMPDLKGLNLAQFGYTSMGGDKRMYLGDGNVKLNIITNDGSYVDISDDEALTKYVVAGQSIEPNTAVKFSYDDKFGEGETWYSTWQSVEEMDIFVKYIGE